MKKTIWISGSHGFVGSHLVTELLPYYHVKQISNSLKYKESNSDNTILINFENKEEIKKTINELGMPDIFIHLGWGSMDDPNSDLHLTTNVIQSQNLIDILFSSGLQKFVFVGSMNEYGEHIGSLSETLIPKGNLTKYAKGKINVAKFGFQTAKKYNKIFIHVRLFYTIGRIERGGALIRDLYNSYKNNTPVMLGPCDHYRDYISISDTVYGLRLLCDVNDSVTVNLGSGKSIQMKDFVKMFWTELGGDSKMLKFGTKSFSNEQSQQNCFANLKLLEEITNGWKPTKFIEEGIRSTIQELQNSPSN